MMVPEEPQVHENKKRSQQTISCLDIHGIEKKIDVVYNFV